MSYEEAMKAVSDEISIRRRDVLLGQANEVYETLIKISKAEKKCQACNRGMNDREIVTMEKTVRTLFLKALRAWLIMRFKLKALIKTGEDVDVAASREDMAEWEDMQQKLQKLGPADVKKKALESEEVPALTAKIKELEKQIPELRSQADEVRSLKRLPWLCSLNVYIRITQEQEKLDELKDQIRDLSNLKQQASTVARLQKEADKARQEAASIENSLLSTGSTRTADDVQRELDELSGTLYVCYIHSQCF